MQKPNYYQNVPKLISQLKEVQKKLEKADAALEVASRKLGLPREDLLKLEAQPEEPSSPELSEDQKQELYFEEILKARSYA